jgi:hypothetical protein
MSFLMFREAGTGRAKLLTALTAVVLLAAISRGIRSYRPGQESVDRKVIAVSFLIAVLCTVLLVYSIQETDVGKPSYDSIIEEEINDIKGHGNIIEGKVGGQQRYTPTLLTYCTYAPTGT